MSWRIGKKVQHFFYWLGLKIRTFNREIPWKSQIVKQSPLLHGTAVTGIPSETQMHHEHIYYLMNSPGQLKSTGGKYIWQTCSIQNLFSFSHWIHQSPNQLPPVGNTGSLKHWCRQYLHIYLNCTHTMLCNSKHNWDIMKTGDICKTHMPHNSSIVVYVFMLKHLELWPQNQQCHLLEVSDQPT